MEDVLDVYQRPMDEKIPVVCVDEKPVQLLGETRDAIPAAPGRPERPDYEYKREGTANIFCAIEPLAGWRRLQVTGQRTKVDFAAFVKELVDERYKSAEKIVLVMDNLNTHSLGSLYEAFEPAEAQRIARKLEIHYTPKHGSWLNVAEIELSALGKRLKDRVGTIENLTDEVAAIEKDRNDNARKVDWQFTTGDARIRLKRLYPVLESSVAVH